MLGKSLQLIDAEAIFVAGFVSVPHTKLFMQTHSLVVSPFSACLRLEHLLAAEKSG